jgi:hypothetical protein
MRFGTERARLHLAFDAGEGAGGADNVYVPSTVPTDVRVEHLHLVNR